MAKTWLEYADMDLQSAKILLQHEGIPQIITFHAQQAIEKALKAYLIFKNKKFPKSHDTYMLFQLCSEHDSTMNKFYEHC